MDDQLTPAWRRWAHMAAAQVVRHMDGAPLVPVSYAFAAQAIRAEERGELRQSTATARRLERGTKPTGPLSMVEKQVLAGLEMDLPHLAIARNVGVSLTRVEEVEALLRKRGLI